MTTNPKRTHHCQHCLESSLVPLDGPCLDCLVVGHTVGDCEMCELERQDRYRPAMYEIEDILRLMPPTEYKLRRMLAFAYSGVCLYGDDGELQDNARLPYIDYIRDSADEIGEKIKARNEMTLAMDETHQQLLMQCLAKSAESGSNILD